MIRTLSLALFFVLAGCAGVAQSQYSASPCAGNEASYECQVVRYQNAP